MARPKGLELTGETPEGGEGRDAPVLPDPLAGYRYRPGKRGPRTSLKPAMIPVIAQSLARYGVLRKAAADAETNEDCLGKWLKRGQQQVTERKRSLYTELLQAVEEAKAHRMGWLIERGEQSLVDRHSNPRFATWLLSVLDRKSFTVPKEPAAAAQSNGLGPAFELVTPDEASAALEAKMRKFLSQEEMRLGVLAEVEAASATGPDSPPPPEGDSGEDG